MGKHSNSQNKTREMISAKEELAAIGLEISSLQSSKDSALAMLRSAADEHASLNALIESKKAELLAVHKDKEDSDAAFATAREAQRVTLIEMSKSLDAAKKEHVAKTEADTAALQADREMVAKRSAHLDSVRTSLLSYKEQLEGQTGKKLPSFNL